MVKFTISNTPTLGTAVATRRDTRNHSFFNIVITCFENSFTVLIKKKLTEKTQVHLKMFSVSLCEIAPKASKTHRLTYSGTRLIRTPRGHAKVSVLSGCPY